MAAKRTENRIRRRQLLKEIIDNFMIVIQHNDTELERISMLKLTNIKLDTCDMLKWLDVSDRYANGSYIYANKGDATAKALPKNQILKNVKLW